MTCKQCRKTDTNDPSGVCVMCRIGGRDGLNPAPKKPEEEENEMKTCECGKEYKPTSNRQKRCPECKDKGKQPKAEKPKPPKSQVELSVAAVVAGSKQPAKLPQKCEGGVYVVDMSMYPELLDQLKAAAHAEHRTPELQIIHLLANTELTTD